MELQRHLSIHTNTQVVVENGTLLGVADIHLPSVQQAHVGCLHLAKNFTHVRRSRKARTPTEHTSQVVASTERQNSDWWLPHSANLVQSAQHPTDCSITTADQNAQSRKSDEPTQWLNRALMR